MPGISAQLQDLCLPLDDLLLDPNNPRFIKSLQLQKPVVDAEVQAHQNSVRGLFFDFPETATTDDEDGELDEGRVDIHDLVESMKSIGFVPIDRIVVRCLKAKSGQKPKYLVIEGNRRVAAAKYIKDRDVRDMTPTEKQDHAAVVETLDDLDVLELATHGLSAEEIHQQVGVILGLRHFGSVLEWGPLAKAVNCFNEYMRLQPPMEEFAYNARRVSEISARLSETRPGVKNALKTYVAFEQLRATFPLAPPRPSHYSLIQACISNRKLATAQFINQDPTTYQLTEAANENMNAVCEFGRRDETDFDKILREPKSVVGFATLVSDATGHTDAAVRSFAASLRDEVLDKEQKLEDAVANLRSFKLERAWTDALEALLVKVVEPGGAAVAPSSTTQLKLEDLMTIGNDQMKLEEARAAFKNVRLILGV